jgi:hypothetical protein
MAKRKVQDNEEVAETVDESQGSEAVEAACPNCAYYMEQLALHTAEIERLQALLGGVGTGKPCEPYYNIQAVTPHGEFWAIKRKFTAVPEKVLVASLSADELKELKETSNKFLSVVLVTNE